MVVVVLPVDGFGQGCRRVRRPAPARLPLDGLGRYIRSRGWFSAEPKSFRCFPNKRLTVFTSKVKCDRSAKMDDTCFKILKLIRLRQQHAPKCARGLLFGNFIRLGVAKREGGLSVVVRAPECWPFVLPIEHVAPGPQSNRRRRRIL